MRSDVLVVVPAWNEAASVADVVAAVRGAGYDIVVVNDGSSDDTSARARCAGATVIDLPFNLGVGAALRCGFKYAVRAGYAAVVQCDADGQHPVGHIDALAAAAVDLDADMVIGSRFARDAGSSMQVGATRRLAMWALSSSASRATSSTVTDATSGFRIIRSPLLEQLATHLPAYYLGDTYEAVVAAGRAGYVVREIPAPIASRRHGSSSASPWRAMRLTARAFVTAVLHVHRRLPPPSR